MPVVIVPPPLAEPISDGRFPYGDIFKVINRSPGTGRDIAGNRNPVVTTETRYVGAFDPAIGFESTNSTEGRISTQPGVYLPYVADVSASSQVLVETGKYAGKLYEVDGDPEFWKHPNTGWEAGCKVPLRKSSG